MQNVRLWGSREQSGKTQKDNGRRQNDREAGRQHDKTTHICSHCVLDHGSADQDEEEQMSICKKCKHFINRHRGKKGGIKGVCELSAAEMRRWTECKATRAVAHKDTCARFEEVENGDSPEYL